MEEGDSKETDREREGGSSTGVRGEEEREEDNCCAAATPVLNCIHIYMYRKALTWLEEDGAAVACQIFVPPVLVPIWQFCNLAVSMEHMRRHPSTARRFSESSENDDRLLSEENITEVGSQKNSGVFWLLTEGPIPVPSFHLDDKILLPFYH